MAWVQV